MVAINRTQIESMLAQIKSTSTNLQGNIRPSALDVLSGDKSKTGKTEGASTRMDFASALQTTLENINNTQVKADQLGNRFAAGDDSVQLSDVMISMQKANITLQTAIQVRNKLVTAYHDMMNMQI